MEVYEIYGGRLWQVSNALIQLYKPYLSFSLFCAVAFCSGF